MNSIKELLNEAGVLNRQIYKLIESSGFNEYDDLSELSCNAEDPDELFIKDELIGALYDLERVSETINNLMRDIKHSGRLHKLSNGRYGFNGIELSCGRCIEALISTEIVIDGYFKDGYKWRAGRIEHNGKDYYFTGCRDANLEGLKVRIRERS